MLSRVVCYSHHLSKPATNHIFQPLLRIVADYISQDALDTPDFTVGATTRKTDNELSKNSSTRQDTDTGANTTASSVAGDPNTDGRKRRWEGNALRKSVLGKKHDRLGENKV